MNYENIYLRLKQLKIEDHIWIVYLGIIILSYYSNDLERIFLLSNDNNARNMYQKIMILIFLILLIIYFYFLKSSFDDVINLNEFDSDDKKKLVYLSFLGSLFVVISGIIFLYISLKNDDLSIELAFN